MRWHGFALGFAMRLVALAVGYFCIFIFDSVVAGIGIGVVLVLLSLVIQRRRLRRRAGP